MARQFEDLRDGDVLEPFHLNIIYRELRRWRKLRVLAPLVGRGIDGLAPPELSFPGATIYWIQLTANGNGNGLHNWQEVQWNGTLNSGAGGYETTGTIGTTTIGDGAMELHGLNCPLGDEVLPAWRNNFGVLVFRAVPVEAVLSAQLNPGSNSSLSTAAATVWSIQSGTFQSSGLTVTASSRWNTTIASGKNVTLFPYVGLWMVRVADC